MHRPDVYSLLRRQQVQLLLFLFPSVEVGGKDLVDKGFHCFKI